MSQKYLEFFLCLPFLWAVTGMFWVPKGSSYINGVCFIAAILCLVKYSIKFAKINFLHDSFLWVLIAYFLYAVFSYMYHGYGSRELRALFFLVSFLLVFPKEKLNSQFFRVFFIIGILGAFGIAVYQYHFLEMRRVQGFIHPITYATFSAMCCIVMLLYAIFIGKGWGKLLFFLLCGLSLWVTVLTLSRGVWLALCATFVCLISLCLCRALKVRKMIFISLPIILSVFFLIVYPFIDQRIEYTKNEVELIRQGNFDSSIGMRLQMWKSAMYSIKKKPVLGFGDRYIKEIDLHYDQGVVSMAIYDFRTAHYHNQFIDKIMKNGFVGLALLLLILYLPVFIAFRDKKIDMFNRLSIISIVSLLSFASLSDVPMNHVSILYCYTFAIYYFLNVHKSSREVLECNTATSALIR